MEDKIHIYFMPGLAAGSNIFEYISLQDQKYELHYLEWIEPASEKEELTVYASRYKKFIKHKNPVLVGVSFGGILIQEIGNLIEVDKLIIISSIKSGDEMPGRLKFIKKSGIYKLFPSRQLAELEDFSKFNFHPRLKKKGELYSKYLSIRNEKYLNWSMNEVLHWKGKQSFNNLIHIHGTKDEIFPIKHIKECIPIEGGTHAMIIIKAKKISKLLETILST